MTETRAARTSGESRPTGTSSVSGVLLLTLLTLSAYFYFFLYRSLRGFEESAASEGERVGARRARWAVTAGITLQFIAFLVLLAGVAPLLTDPAVHQAFWNGLGQGRIELPAELREAATLTRLTNWAGWLVFWTSLFAFLGDALRRAGRPTGAAGFAGVLIGFRVLVGLAASLGATGLEASIASFDWLIELTLVSCFVSAANAVWIARNTVRAG